MTNKEAKEKLYMEWQKFLEDNIDYAGISEAYKIAFKALEQEPCDKCVYSTKDGCQYDDITETIPPFEPYEDVISRQAVLEIIRFEDKWLLDAKSHNADTEIAFDGMLSKVSDLPSVKQKFTDEEIQKMQDLEQAQIQKEYELGIRIASGYWSRIPEELAKLSPVKPKEITGEWIQHEEDGSYWVECSVCHSERAFGKKFCPNCGAKMKE